MELIVISPESILKNEANLIHYLFENGLQTLHLRKPESTLRDFSGLLEEITEEDRKKIVIHDHFSLTDKFDLKGVHLNSRNPYYLSNKELSISRSCHSIEEINNNNKFDYVFLSPIFDSISKRGYKQGFSHEQLLNAGSEGIINNRVIALGGIDKSNISQIKQYGFGGIAILGTLWEIFTKNLDSGLLIKRFLELQKLCKQS